MLAAPHDDDDDLQPFGLKYEPKMSRGTLKYMLQISVVQLKTLSNSACQVVNNTCTFLPGNGNPDGESPIFLRSSRVQ